MKKHFGAEVPLKFIERRADVRVHLDFWRRMPASRTPRRKPLDLADRQPPPGGPLGVAHSKLPIRHGQEATTVARRQLPFFNPILNLWLQLQKANGVRHSRAVLAGSRRDSLLS